MSRIAADDRRVPWWVFVILVLMLTIVPAFISVVLLDGGVGMEYPDLRSVVIDLVIPSAVSLAVVSGTVTAYRLWGPVLHERRRVRPWLWIIPAALAGTALAATDYRRLVDSGLVGAVGLLGVLLLVTSEELVFRGVVLHEARRRVTETRAAWISSLTFGLIHLLGGPIQVLVSTAFGHLAYYARRVSGGIVVPIILHFLWNGSLLTGLLTDDPSDEGMASVYLTLVSFGLLVALAVGHRAIGPRAREEVDVDEPPAA